MSKKECDGSCAKKALKKYKRKNEKGVKDREGVKGVRDVKVVVGAQGTVPVREDVKGVRDVEDVAGAQGPVPVEDDPRVVPEPVPESIPESVEESTPESAVVESPAKLLGEAVKKARKELKLSRKDLGRLIGVSRKQIILIEKNVTDAELGTLIQVCKALSIHLNISAELTDKTVTLG